MPSESNNTGIDFYNVLEIPRTANKSDIQKQYRSIALKNHPAKNSTPQAQKEFAKAAESYTVLSNSKQYLYAFWGAS